MAAFVPRRISVAETRTLRQRVLRSPQTLEKVAADEPGDAFAVGAFAGARLFGVGMISPGEDGTVWRVQGMATDPSVRGQGAGSTVLAALVQHATDEGARRVWCNARTPALSLYTRAGFRPASEEFELPGTGRHFVMELMIEAGPS